MSSPDPNAAVPAAPEDRLDRLSLALALAAIALALYLYLGRLDGTPLQRGNEAMYASPPALMLENGDYLVPRYRGEHFLDKPILPFWIVAASYRLLGVSVSAERLPTAIAGLMTALVLGLWIRRRGGDRAGLLAGLILAFSFLFVFTGMTFAADAFLTFALVAASIVLDQACRREDGSDAFWGALSGLALAAGFGFKGLIGLVLPVGAVATTLLLDRRWPVRAWRRGAWAFAVIVALLAPYHWAMDRRLGKEFWDVFYWRNQFLRGASRLYMRPHRGVLYYVGVLAWGLFPWSFLVPASLGRRRPSSLPLGALVFGLAFWSPLVMKREVYAVTLLPAAAALVAERIGTRRSGKALRWESGLWALAALLTLALVGFWVRAYPSLARAAGAAVSIFAGVTLVALTLTLLACAIQPRRSRALFATVLACGLVCLAGRLADERFGRFDPLPAWGARARAACAAGCDGFVYGEEVTSLEFYSGFEWTPVLDPGREIPVLRRHDQAFLLVKTSLEPALAELPLKWEVLDRCPTYGSYSLDQFVGPKKGASTMLSLVRIVGEDASFAEDNSP
ncbi:MAG TPA: glycosyltransferase family 39 protein [Thermoanaerobaculia bacterium]